MSPTVNDVLVYCQEVYARMRMFPPTEEFVSRFTAHVAAIGRRVCYEQGKPYAWDNGLPNTTPLGEASTRLFTELQRMAEASTLDPAVVDDIMGSVSPTVANPTTEHAM